MTILTVPFQYFFLPLLLLVIAPVSLGDNTIIMLYDLRSPYIEQRNGAITGLVATPVITALERAQIRVQWQQASPVTELQTIKHNRGQYCSAGWFHTPERAAFAQYSVAVYRGGKGVLVIRKDDTRFARINLRQTLLDSDLIFVSKKGFSYGVTMDAWQKTHPENILSNDGNEHSMARLVINKRADYLLMSHGEAEALLSQIDPQQATLTLHELTDMPQSQALHVICAQQVAASVMQKLNRALLDTVGDIEAQP